MRSLPVLTGSVALGSTGMLTGCAGTPYIVPSPAPDGWLVGAASMVEGGVFIQPPGFERPIWVGPDGSGEVHALLASCTHRGCQPDPVGDRLVCPCHGSEFALDGAVLAGPAERPLTSYPVERRGDGYLVRVRSER